MRASLFIQSQTAVNFLISAFRVAQIAAETVLIQMIVRLHVPVAASIRRDLIRQDDLTVIAAELQLEVDELDANAGEILP